jgi:hypothetical protein
MLLATYTIIFVSPSETGNENSLEFVLGVLRGAVTDFSLTFSRQVILISIKESSRESALYRVSETLSSNALASSEAGSLFSTCRWVLCHGHFGVGALPAIKACQYDSPFHPVKGV